MIRREEVFVDFAIKPDFFLMAQKALHQGYTYLAWKGQVWKYDAEIDAWAPTGKKIKDLRR